MNVKKIKRKSFYLSKQRKIYNAQQLEEN